MNKKLPEGLATYWKYMPEFHEHFNKSRLRQLSAIWDSEVKDFPIDDFSCAEQFCAHFYQDAGARVVLMRLILENESLRPKTIPREALEAMSVNADWPEEDKKKSEPEPCRNYWSSKEIEILTHYCLKGRLSVFQIHWDSDINGEEMPAFRYGEQGSRDFFKWVAAREERVADALCVFYYFEDSCPIGLRKTEFPSSLQTRIKKFSYLARPAAPASAGVSMSIGSIHAQQSWVANEITVGTFKEPRILEHDPLLKYSLAFMRIFSQPHLLDRFTKTWNSYDFQPDLPYFGSGQDGAQNWLNHFKLYPSQRNELIYILQNHSEYRPAEVDVKDLPNWGRPQCPYGLPRNMRH